MATLTIRTAIILIPIIGATMGPVYTWDLATIGITDAASFIAGGTGKTISASMSWLEIPSQLI